MEQIETNSLSSFLIVGYHCEVLHGGAYPVRAKLYICGQADQCATQPTVTEQTIMFCKQVTGTEPFVSCNSKNVEAVEASSKTKL